ncbi:hypothetical protein [Polyangium jinanense]|uniref:Uncharacterized protein n=1 Tax=Polyangium jinanense TaxID=2829994 RepID=A0A9X3X316_9BACT|nr:hypothetical protein [Polyangium jinanense]MDC3955284.1 hypothetical protein [Polyangium jinanense]MDC3981585.1 hypothetical protein [Polyangium jinanense]
MEPARVVVPEGHQLKLFGASPEPCLVRSDGGVWLANLGTASDDPVRELDELSHAVKNALRDEPSRALLADGPGAFRLSDLFAPAEPQVSPTECPVVWTFHQGSAKAWTEAPARLQVLLRHFYRIGRQREPRVPQWVYVVDDDFPQARAFVGLLGNLGIPVMRPESEQRTIVVEVHRPEGMILSALGGQPYATVEGPVDAYIRAVNAEKDRAEAANDKPRIERLEEEERDYLAKRIGSPAASPDLEPVVRAPRLSSLLLEVDAARGSEEALQKLYRELLVRPIPLLLVGAPKNRSLELRSFPDVGPALPAFPDLRSLHWMAADLQRPPGSFGIAAMRPLDLIVMAGKQGTAIALNVYRDPKTPVYVLLSGEAVRALAEQAKRATRQTGE